MSRAYNIKDSSNKMFGDYLYVPDGPQNFAVGDYTREFSREDGYYYPAAVNYYNEVINNFGAGHIDSYYTNWFWTTPYAEIYENVRSSDGIRFLYPLSSAIGSPGFFIEFDNGRKVVFNGDTYLLEFYVHDQKLFHMTWTQIIPGITTFPWYYPELDDSNLYFYGMRHGNPIGPDHYFWNSPPPTDMAPTNPRVAYLPNSSWGINKENLELFFSGIKGFDPVNPDKDPFEDGGTSEEGGGGGNFSEDSDKIETEMLPIKGAVGTGFATIFTPSAGQLKDLSGLFWNADVFSFLQNMVENINSMFTSLGVVPFIIPAGANVSVTWLGIDTAVILTLAERQYLEFDMGSINLAKDSRIFTSNSALDYSPFSKLGIYLPFIGFRDLDIDECRNSVMGLKYKIDIMTGTCVAIISLDGNSIYQFSGNCLSQIPITNENMASLISNVTNVAIAGANAYNAASASQAGLDELGTKATDADRARAHMAIGKADSRLSSSTANAVLSGKPSFEKTGSVSATSALLSIKQPYLFLTTPRQSLPANYNRYKGYPCNMTAKLGELRGYTVVDDIRLNGLVATSPEVSEIYELLKGGVII